MLEILAVSADAWYQTLGRLHPAVVHFPIALLVVAGLLEFWRIIIRKRAASPTAVVCLAIGAIASIIAVILGLLDEHYVAMDDTAIHQWLGIATAVLCVLVLIFAIWNRPERANPVYRIGLIIAAVLVSATGYYGGELTYGQGYLTELVWPASSSTTPASTQPADTNSANK